MFLHTIAEDEATGEVAEIYGKQAAQSGFVMEASKCFTARPDLLPIYTAFIDKIRGGLRPIYRLVTSTRKVMGTNYRICNTYWWERFELLGGRSE